MLVYKDFKEKRFVFKSKVPPTFKLPFGDFGKCNRTNDHLFQRH